MEQPKAEISAEQEHAAALRERARCIAHALIVELLARRVELEWSWNELAATLEVSVSTLHQWRLNKKSPSFKSLINLTSEFGMALVWLQEEEHVLQVPEQHSQVALLLRSRREQLGLEQHQLAARSGLTQQQISRMEQGSELKYGQSLDNLSIWSLALGWELSKVEVLSVEQLKNK